ncbi:nucleotide exchange factor GrpE [Synechocystis sp. PCC 7509]|uniref:nucleotide exchange factor GrpE n=1 Tax=Synechocystis sp. PCC 7509 TaxID=927677 RepID=UPI0002ACC427|nr:nucleotide exchange factor GrpE [Synechocystis sp. PCC 7509]
MSKSSKPNYTDSLQTLMQRVGISSFKALASASGVSQKQIMRLRRGEVEQMRVETILKLAQVLKVPINVLMRTFLNSEIAQPPTEDKTIATLKQEYQKLQHQLEQQKQTLLQEFQLSTLQVLESCLLQLPTFEFKVKEHPEISATKLLPLIRPLQQLLQQWGIEQIAPVGEKIPYNPQLHQLLSGNAQPSDLVIVRYTGYIQGEKLLYRAKVSLVE